MPELCTSTISVSFSSRREYVVQTLWCDEFEKRGVRLHKAEGTQENLEVLGVELDFQNRMDFPLKLTMFQDRRFNPNDEQRPWILVVDAAPCQTAL